MRTPTVRLGDVERDEAGAIRHMVAKRSCAGVIRRTAK